MSLTNIFRISSQGMTVQRERLETASANLANSNTTRTAEGGAYRRRDVVVESVDMPNPQTSFGNSFGSLLPERSEETVQGAHARIVVSDRNEGTRRFQPDHPDADGEGYVTMPDVDPLEETVNMLSAARAFEANATAFNTAKEMARTSLKLADA